MTSNFVLDASALLALINTESGHEKVARLLPESCISTVNLSEVATVMQSIGVPDNEIHTLLEVLVPKVISFDKEQAFETAKLRTSTKNMGLSLGNRACLALGKILNIPVVTADKTWAKLDLKIKVNLIR